MMAALCEDGTYGLNCGRKSDKISVLHVKLTESAFKALENYQNCKVSDGKRTILWRDRKSDSLLGQKKWSNNELLLFR